MVVTVDEESGEEFQSTPPRGKRLGRASALPRWRPTGFNPRPRAGSDGRVRPAAHQRRVSIHAPARESDRPPPRRRCRRRRRFNPRPRAGSDRRARPWRASRSTRFNPRPRAGSDTRSRLVSSSSPWSFNPRPRAGSDATISSSWNPTASFNPRPRAGSDMRDRFVFIRTGGHGFQSTPPRGKRLRDRQGNQRLRIWFQSTPPRGKRRAHQQAYRRRIVSIHAPAREATRPAPRRPGARW